PLLRAPLMTTRTGTAPVRAAAGIRALICHTPTSPGARPEYSTSAKLLPMATHMTEGLPTQAAPSAVGWATVADRGLAAAGTPSATAGETSPWPTPKI